MSRLFVITVIVMTLFLPSVLAFGEPSAKRLQALKTLWQAYTDYRLGSVAEGERGVDKALSIDPDLAYANIVKAEIAMKSQNWETSKKYFERGLSLLKQPDQPVSPDNSARISPWDVEADSRCFLGYIYIKLAQQANQEGKANAEQEYLSKAQKSLRAGLALAPGNEARELAERLLKMFK